MIRYAANLTMLYNEVPFPERFEKAAASGFRAVEFLFIHNVDAGAVATASWIVVRRWSRRDGSLR